MMNTEDAKSNLIENFVRSIDKYINIIEKDMGSHTKFFNNSFKWYRAEDSGFKLFNKLIIENSPENIPELFSDWQYLINSINQHQPFFDFINKGAYFEFGMSGRLPIYHYFFSLLPDLIINSFGHIIFDRSHDTHQVVSDFIDCIEIKRQEIITLIPILDIRTHSKFNIAENIEFREFTHKEKEYILNNGLISINLRQGDLDKDFCDWHGLVIRHHSIISHDSENMSDIGNYTKRQKEIESLIEDFLTSAVFVLEERKMPSLLNSRPQRLSYTTIRSNGFSIVDDQKSAQMSYGFRETKHDIDDACQAAMFDVLRFIKEEKSKEYNKIKLAMKRLYFSKTRRSKYDRILDLMIAAELLHRRGSKSEISLRISLNAANYSDDQNKLAVYNSFKEAYDVRSQIVHEGSVDEKIDIVQISNNVEKYLIQGIRKTICKIQEGTYRNTDSITDMLSKLSSTEKSG
jgi:hypothetical protein